MSRLVGTVSRGIRAPIIREGDDIAKLVTESVLAASEDEEWGFSIRNRDIIAMTEAIVARAQGNYATVDDIAEDVAFTSAFDDMIKKTKQFIYRSRFEDGTSDMIVDDVVEECIRHFKKTIR